MTMMSTLEEHVGFFKYTYSHTILRIVSPALFRGPVYGWSAAGMPRPPMYCFLRGLNYA